MIQGGIVKKRAAQRIKFKPDRLAVSDPIQPSNDISSGTFEIHSVGCLTSSILEAHRLFVWTWASRCTRQDVGGGMKVVKCCGRTLWKQLLSNNGGRRCSACSEMRRRH